MTKNPNKHNLKFRGLAVLALLFPSGGFRNQSGERNSTTIKKERRHLASVALLIFSYVRSSRTACYFLVSYFPKQKLLKTIYTLLRAIIPHHEEFS